MEAGDTLFHRFNVLNWNALQTKWFSFRGTIGGALSPSVSPIFEHKHPGGLPMNVTLRVYWPGDLCSTYLTGTGPPCPDHWKSVTTLPGYDPAWHLVGATLNRWWGYDSYKVERGELGKILSVTDWILAKRSGGYAYVWVIQHLLRIAGRTYLFPIPSTTGLWQWFSHRWPLNPHTLLPWTQTDLDSLQPGIALRRTTSVGWTATGSCDQLYIVVERGINCPDD